MTKTQKKKQQKIHLKTIARSGGLARMEQLRQSGQLQTFQKNGARAMINKYGRAKIAEKVAEWRRTHSSQDEIRAYQILRSVGVVVLEKEYNPDDPDNGPIYAYTEHMPIKNNDQCPYVVDIAWPIVRVGLEIDGPVHTIFDSPARQLYSVRRDETLKSIGWKIFHLSSDDLDTDYGAKIIADVLAMIEFTVGVEKEHGVSIADTYPTDDLNWDEVPY